MCVAAHHCGALTQRWGGSTRSRSQLCESRRYPRGCSAPTPEEHTTFADRVGNHGRTRSAASKTHLDKVHGSRSESGQPAGRLVPDVVHHLHGKITTTHTYTHRQTGRNLSAGGPTAALNTNGLKLKQSAESRRRKRRRKPCADPNTHARIIV